MKPENRKLIGSLYYVALSYMIDYRLKFEQAKQLMQLIINNDLGVINLIKQIGVPSDELINVVKELKKYNAEIDDTEKDILSNGLIKSMYSWIYHRGKASNKDMSYTERERENYQAILIEVKIDLLLAYLKEGKNLKKEYSSFKSDLKEYAANLGVISQLADNKEEGLKICIEERMKDTRKLLDKYKGIFPLTEGMLITTFEQDLIERKRNNKLRDNERELVRAFA